MASSKERSTKSSTLLQLFQYADKWDVFLIFVGSMAALANGLTLPAMILTRSNILDNFGKLGTVSKSQIMDEISGSARTFAYIAVVAAVASYLEVSCWMCAGERQVSRIRLMYLRSMLRQNVAYFDTETSTSEVVNSISVDTLILQEAISEKAGNFIRNATQFVGCYLVGFTQAWRLSAVALPFTPLLIIPGILYGKVSTKFEIEKNAAYSKSATIVEQALSSIRTVYAYVGERQTLSSYCESLAATMQLGLKQGLVKGFAIGSGGVTFALWSLLAWYGSVLVLQRKTTGAHIITTGLALLNGGRSLGFAISNIHIFNEGQVSAYKIFEMIKRVPDIDIHDNTGSELSTVHGRLELKNVDYSYPTRPGISVLNDLTLEIPSGKSVALVGSSGSGKSTVIALLERFYDPLQGEILLDGVDIKTLKLTWYRRQLGLVSQEPALFATSIAQNIQYGKGGASMEEVIAAAKSANAHDFIQQFPSGYNTQVGERGVQLSGGQKQRIAIARAILKRPPIFLLDEATSALDSESEKVVQTALDKLSSGSTCVIVAHRLSTIKNANIIAVMGFGTLVELGTHEELLRKVDGAYASLVQLQETKLQETKHDPDETETSNEAFASSHIEEVSFSSNHSSGLTSGTLPASERQDVPKATCWDLAILSRPEWKQALWGVTGACGFGFIQPTYSFIIGSMVSVYYLPEETMELQVFRYGLLFGALSVMSFVVNLVQHYNFGSVGEHMTLRLREKMLGNILRFEVGWFDRDENSSGAICSKLANETNTIRALVVDLASLLIQTGSAVAVSFILGFATSWRMCLLMVGLQPLLVGCYYLKLVFLKGFSKKAAKATEDSSQVASEAVSQHRTITAFSAQDNVISLFMSKMEVAVRDGKKRCQVAGLGLGLAHLILYGSWSLQFWYGGTLFLHGKASLKDVFRVFFVFLSTGRVIAEALSLAPDLAKGPRAIQSAFDIIRRKTEIDADEKMSHVVTNVVGELRFCNVNFAYPSRPDVLIFRGFSLEVAAGSSMALVGQSGSGKSTIVSLIQRFYDPQTGVVTVDGMDIKQLHLETFRKQVGLVGQEPVLFAASVWENIAYGKPTATLEEITEAAQVANAHSFISALPNGYNTFAGERGLQLSGGQKQRIAIARAVLKKPAILLLDEATSALDMESEHLVQDALNKVMVGRTTVVVAHRLSTVAKCDTIAVLKDGAIFEEGTHSELLTKGAQGAYFSLLQLQAK